MKRLIPNLLVAAALLGSSLLFAQTKTAKIVVQTDIKVLDPTFTTAYITRDFGYMVYDTLFALDSKNVARPQMVDTWTSSKDGKQWSFTLRKNLRFSDGSTVSSADIVASIQRWQARDSLGKQLGAVGAEWKPNGPEGFTLTLSEPFGMVLQALAKPSSFPLVILPERLAKAPATSPLSEVTGSGPYMFKRDEWVPGNKVVFVKNPHYVPRSEPADGLAGGKTVAIDRVEWIYLPDANSAISALKQGEVDMIAELPPDFILPLRADPNVKVHAGAVLQGFLVPNHLFPPFSSAKARQAVQMAVNQEKFMAAVGVPPDMRKAYCGSWFICGSANETNAGDEAFRRPDIAKAKQLLAESGYRGEKVVLLVASDMQHTNALAMMAAATMRSIGMNVEMQTMDWASIVARRSKKDAPDAGGWNMYITAGAEFDVNSPITNVYLGAACGNSLPGWPCDKRLDELRTAWVRETDAGKQKQLLDEFNRRAYEAPAYIMAGQYQSAFAARSTLKGADKLWRGIPLAWMLDK